MANTMPALGLLVKPLMDRPGKASVPSTLGFFSAISPMRRDHGLGAVQRGAVRQLREADQVLLVLRGNEAVRHRLEHAQRWHGQHRVDTQHGALCAPARRAGGRSVLLGTALEDAIEAAEQPAEGAVHAAGVSDPSARRGCAAAGRPAPADSVSELSAEITVEIAMVTANCR
jgi:hypothetical protein